MKRCLIIASSYILDALLEGVSIILGITEKDISINVLEELYSGRQSARVNIFDCLDNALLHSDIIYFFEGFYNDCQFMWIPNLKNKIKESGLPYKIIKGCKNKYLYNAETVDENLIKNMLGYNNEKPTILIINIQDPSNPLKLELFLAREFLKRNLNVCQLFSCDIFNNDNKYIALHEGTYTQNLIGINNQIANLMTETQYKFSDLLIVSLPIEVNKISFIDNFAFNILIRNLKADYIVACVPENVISYKNIKDTLKYKHGLQIDDFLKSQYIMHPFEDGRFIKQDTLTLKTITRRYHRIYNNVLKKLSVPNNVLFYNTDYSLS